MLWFFIFLSSRYELFRDLIILCLGSFAANSGSSATTSAEGSEDEHIEEKGKPFLTPGFAAVVGCFSGVLMLLAVDPSLL